MARNVRTYEHFCLVARALERVGDRWSLLAVRDLLSGPKRFTDLMDRLGGITPKTLTHRLRELEDVGVVAADRQAGRREVWYRLTPAGEDLAPAVEALGWWAWRHAWRAPTPGEAVHGEHLLLALVMVFNRDSGDHRPARWHFRFLDDGEYTLRSDGGRWSLISSAPDGPPDVAVVTTAASWMAFLRDPGVRGNVEISGGTPAVHRFERLMRDFHEAASASRS